MLLITVIAPAWLAWVGAAPAHERPELVSVALHQGAQGLSFDLFHPQMPTKVKVINPIWLR